MCKLQGLFDNNRAWANQRVASDPEFFQRLARQQSPKYLWIGCADSRVPANEILGLEPGEVFVHRNITNVVVPGSPTTGCGTSRISRTSTRPAWHRTTRRRASAAWLN
jgi:carbonic anhydrase